MKLIRGARHMSDVHLTCQSAMRHEVFLGANHRDRFKIWMNDVLYSKDV